MIQDLRENKKSLLMRDEGRDISGSDSNRLVGLIGLDSACSTIRESGAIVV